MDQLQKNQVQEEQRQRNAAAIRRPFANDKAAAGVLDNGEQVKRDQYNARQRALLDEYRSATAVQPVGLPQPAKTQKPSQTQGGQ